MIVLFEPTFTVPVIVPLTMMMARPVPESALFSAESDETVVVEPPWPPVVPPPSEAQPSSALMPLPLQPPTGPVAVVVLVEVLLVVAVLVVVLELVDVVVLLLVVELVLLLVVLRELVLVVVEPELLLLLVALPLLVSLVLPVSPVLLVSLVVPLRLVALARLDAVPPPMVPKPEELAAPCDPSLDVLPTGVPGSSPVFAVPHAIRPHAAAIPRQTPGKR